MDLDCENIFDSSLKIKFIQKSKCNASYAEKVIKKMQEYGLYLCRKELTNSEYLHSDIPSSIKFNLEKFIKAAELVDKFKDLNYSKKRTNTSKKLKEFLRQHKLYPRND